MARGNINRATWDKTFPPLTITEAEAKAGSNPVQGDPGAILEKADGSWKWYSTEAAALADAGSWAAVYPAFEVCAYFKKFADDVKFSKDGSETDLGPMPQ